MKKTILALPLILCLVLCVFAFSSCGKKGASVTTAEEQTAAATTAEITTAAPEETTAQPTTQGHVHTPEDTITVLLPPTCSNPGIEAYLCVECGAPIDDTYEEIPIDPEAHVVEVWNVTEEVSLLHPTGSRSGVCTECHGNVVQETAFTPTVYDRSDDASVNVFPLSAYLTADVLKDDHFYPTDQNPNGKDFVFEMAILWNETMLNCATDECEICLNRGGSNDPLYTFVPVNNGYAQYLSDIGFDVFLTANNHILDKGTAGLRRTIDVLEQKGLIYTGVARDAQADTLLNPLMLHVRGLRIAIVNFTYGTNTGPWDPWPKVNYMRKKDILPMLERAREADLVLVFPHWGTEYQLHHDKQQDEMAHWLVENGADVVVGAHPHVIQDVEYIGESPVMYSLGNALSNQNDLNSRLELALTLRVVLEEDQAPRLLEPSFEYIWCTKPGMVEDSYAAVPVTLPESHWRNPSDHQDMLSTYRKIYEENHYAGSGRSH